MKKLIPLAIVSLLLFQWSCMDRKPDQEESNTTADMQEAAILEHHRELGDSLVKVAQAELLKNVGEAMAEGGPANAVAFCNIHAPGIVTEMAAEWNCTVRRTSLQYRNPDHIPTEEEESILKWYAGLGEGDLTSTVWRDEGVIHYASPIRVGLPACLKCHGDPEREITAATMAMIKENYPEDQAVGYAMGDLRGMWHLTFTPKPAR